MATGDRRSVFSARRGMTVLGKIPAVPKPINLPSQRLENRGLDPSVEIVPRGTFSWGTGRSPPTSGSPWGNVGLSSSPPVGGTGAWNTASTSAPVPSSSNNSGGALAQNPPGPLSAGSTRPSSAGSTRPLSASTTTGRAWAAAAKLEEQVQPSRFNLTTAEFPTLGSEKNPNLRPQQTPSNRPTSADAMKERHLAYADHYQSGTFGDRPTSADATKERKPVYPGAPHTDRPTSADGSHPDKGRHQSAPRLPSRQPYADGTLPDQRHPFYGGLVGHGTAGPGPGNLDQPKENYNTHPLPIQHGIGSQGRDFVFPGASQHDLYFNRPGGPHANDVVVLPMDGRPQVYGSYSFDARSNHPDMSRVHHPQPHPQPSWGPNHLDRSGIHPGQFLQSGPPEHFNVMQPQRRRMETSVLHEQPVAGTRREDFGINDKEFGEQRGGWAGRNVVYMGPPLDSREPPISTTTGTGQELPRPDMFLSSWGHQPMHAGWGNMYGGDMTVGMYQEMSSSVMHQQATFMETTPQRSVVEGISESTRLEDNGDKGTGHVDEALHHISSLGHQASAVSVSNTSTEQDMQCSRKEETVQNFSVLTLGAGSESSKKRNNARVSGGPMARTQPSKTKEEEEQTRSEQNRELQKIHSSSNMAAQRQEDKSHGNFQGFNRDNHAAKDSHNGLGIDAKDASSKKKILSLQQSNKGMREADQPVHDSEEKTSLIKASNGNVISDSILSSAGTSKASDKGLSNDPEVQADGFAKLAQDTRLQASANDLQGTPTPNCVVPGGVPFSEEEKVPVDDVSKSKRNSHPVRRGHHGRSMHDPHSVDRQHVNHGMVWAPKPIGVGTTKEESQLLAGDGGDMHESLQKATTDVKKRGKQPLLDNESQGETQVQQMQSAASSQQGQGQQVQEQSVVSSKGQVQQIQHKRVERSSKKQGRRIEQQQSRSSVSEQLVKEEQCALFSCKNQSLRVNQQQSVAGSCAESGEAHSQVVAISQRDMQSKSIHGTQEAEKAGEVTSTPILDKFEGKKNKEEGPVYVRKSARNQQRQQHEPEYEAADDYNGQQSYSKADKATTEDQENLVSDTSALSVSESRKTPKEFKSRSSRSFKQLKKEPHESIASVATGEGQLSSGDRPQVEARGETHVPSPAIEPKVLKDKEERTQIQKLVRQQEVQIKQSATGSHQEHRHFGEEHKADSLSSESSTIKTEKKLYVPKQARKQYLQPEFESSGQQGQGRQGKTSQEVTLSNDKGQHDRHGLQPSGTQPNVRKNDMERYTPVPARKPNMQGHQSAARGQRAHTFDMTGGEDIRVSSGHVVNESCLREPVRISDSMGKELPLSAMVHRDESKVHESSESGSSKREVKHYIVKPGGQQQQLPSNGDEEVHLKEEKWQRSHRAPGAESVKRKDGMKLYTPVPARQAETPVALEGKIVQEIGVPSPEQQNGKEETNPEFDRSQKNRNHAIKAPRSAPFHHSQKRLQLEYTNDTQQTQENSVHTAKMDETNGSIREHKKDQESRFNQKTGFRRGHNDGTDNPSLEDGEVMKPRQYQRRNYHYQPVVQQLQNVKLQGEDLNAPVLNSRQVDQGHIRYERREVPRRGRGHGHGYGYRAADHAYPSDAR